MAISGFTRRDTIFQSTLSMRRATIPNYLISSDFVISIHALHEESDQEKPERGGPPTDFNPRSP